MCHNDTCFIYSRKEDWKIAVTGEILQVETGGQPAVRNILLFTLKADVLCLQY